MFLTNPFNDPANWELVWDIHVQAQQLTEGAFIAIPRQQCPLLLSYPICCFEVSNPHTKPYWRKAGSALQEIRTGILVGGQPETISSSKYVSLNELNFITFDNYTDGWTLYFQPAYWHKEILLKCWEYQNKPRTLETDAIQDLLRQLLSKLNAIESKIDSL